KQDIPKPNSVVETISSATSSGINFYITDETFSFESDAKKTCVERMNNIKNYGVSVIGCRVIEKDNDYSFIIEYIPELKNSQLVNPIIISEYLSSRSYWNENDAEKNVESAFMKLKNSPLKPIDKIVFENNGEYFFKITYIVTNIIKKSQKYYVKFEKIILGNYTFESEAKKAIPQIINNLKQNNIAALKGKVIERNNNYSVEIEYLNKTNNINTSYNNPEYSVDKYVSQETFTFETEALKEGIKRNDMFLKAGLNVILNYAVQNNNDWSFGTDYIVKNIYKNGILVGKEHLIKRYDNIEVFDFESEAKKELEEKIKNFKEAGLYPISYKVFEVNSGYSFFIDYIHKIN
ncbi:MAG: hypothetical protein N2Z20_04840, partial [Elusimicrobiales bacterium]|nr:hypothetical protein [Elusimicrobiales bacterium]